MRLLRLKLENYQGLKEFELNADGKDVIIKSDNGGGKTTVANALTWLLYDKASTGEKGYTPKTTDANGDEVHYMHHSAEGMFQKDDGSIISLKRDFFENWQKVRGSNAESFKGHNIEHYVDGVPVKEKEYKDILSDICDSEQAMMLTIPEYFADTMTWQKRREILLDVCGYITDEDVIKNTAELADLPIYLLKLGTTDQYYTVEEYAAIAKSKKAEINKDLQMIPARIDEAKKAMPDVAGIDADTIDHWIMNNEQDKTTLEQERNMIDINQTSSVRGQLADVKSFMAEDKVKYNETQEKVNEETRKGIQTGQTNIFDTENLIRELGHKRDNVKDRMQRITQQRASLLEEYNVVLAHQYIPFIAPEIADNCPTCGQAIPTDQIEDAKAKHTTAEQLRLEEFNLAKSQNLEKINQKGITECSKTLITELQDEVDKYDAEIIRLTEVKTTATITMENLKSRIVVAVPFEDTPEGINYLTKIARLNETIETGSNNATEAKNAMQLKIDVVNKNLADLQDKKASIRIAQTQQKRIEDLMANEKDLASQYEYIDHGVWLTEEFTRAKAKMLTDKINSKFDTIRFKLFVTQVNGGQTDTCEVLVQTTEGLKQFKKANNGARINGGIEITKVLSDHWGISMPLILDNCESVTRIQPTTAQQIRMYVNEAYPQLTIETERSLKVVKGA